MLRKIVRIGLLCKYTPNLDIINEENINKTKNFIISKISDKVGIDLQDSIIFEKY